MQKLQRHEFALYVSDLNIFNNQLKIDDDVLYHRIVRILRLTTGDQIILFNSDKNALFEIAQISKKEIILILIRLENNKALAPNITICISLLKKESFEEALYYCVELGANIVQPIITEKSHLKKLTEKDIERFDKILISAAEQSKNFNLVKLEKIVTFDEYLKQLNNNNDLKIFFDAQGQSFINLKEQINKNQNLTLFIGPEGDLSNLEKELLLKNDFKFCKLTPTILRAQSAVLLSIGIFRSLLNK